MQRKMFVAALLSAWALTLIPARAGAAPAEVLVTAESFAGAVAAATPGTTLLLADGLYRDVNWQFKAKGQAERPITLRARRPGKASLTGKSQLVITGEHLIVRDLLFDQVWGPKVVEFSSARHCRLTDCAFVECGNPENTFSHVVDLVKTSPHNRVDHCYFQGSLSMSIGVRVREGDTSSTHNTFAHNYFKDIVRRSDNGQEAVQVGQGTFSSRRAMHTLVEHCLFEGASGDSEIISNKSCCNTYRFNTFRDCRAALTLRSGGSVLVQGNVFLNCQAGVRVHAANSAIVGNVIEGCDDGLLLNMGNGPEIDALGYVAAHHCLFANNIIRNCKTSGVRIGGGSGAPMAPFENLFVNNIIIGIQGDLLRFDKPNEQHWRAMSLWPQGKARPGAQPEGVAVEPTELRQEGGIQALPASRAGRISEFSKEIAPLLSAMQSPRTFVEVFPEKLEVKALRPQEVGPAWMQGRPETLARIPNPRPAPPLPKKPPKNGK